ncbi:MFS transporter [Acuticoccus sp. I52.16.1]|uniref:MFS transporter n=1 Tax=Acuticoccus sp. I52.16.1 TaxID=2928472 RepID=UPI001FD368A1|nr:MFS transporter [Acuticoccus sp. I52.16.1]UOM33333.1 MFS transporter [Acuticoccus sp. I52.16.1]
MSSGTIEATPERVSVRSALAPVAALLLGTALLYLGYGLQATLIPLRADLEGFSRVAIGLLSSTYYAGFVAGCVFAPYLILRAGHIRAFAAMVSLVSAAALSFPLVTDEVSWMVFRFGTGFCISGLLVIIESWLNEKATNTTRGTVMSTYIVITYATISIGQLGVAVQPISSFALFAMCSIMLSIAAVPVALTKASQPAPIPVVKFNPGILWQTAPAAFVGSFLSGVMAGSFNGLGSIFAIDSGFRTDEAAIFVSASVMGGAIGQYPLGRISDFVDRRLVLLGAAAATAAIGLLMAFADFLPDIMILAFGFVVGLTMLPIYSLAAAHAYDWTPPEEIVPTSAALLIVFGVGSIFGPLVASTMMALIGPGGLFLTIACSAVTLVLFVSARITIRRRPKEEFRSDFDYASTAVVGGAITPEIIEEDDPSMEMPVGFTPFAAGVDDDDEPNGDTIEAPHEDDDLITAPAPAAESLDVAAAQAGETPAPADHDTASGST